MKHVGLMLGLLLCALLVGGCARAALDTTGFAITDTALVQAPHEDAWQMTKAVLREEGLDIYTRDKRGTFVAYTPMKRGIFRPQPKRTEFTFELDDLNNNTTQLTATTVRQIYGVTLLTYPGWHDRNTEDNTQTLEIIQAVQAKAAGGFVQPARVDTPASELGRPKQRRGRWLNPATWFGRRPTPTELPTIQEQQAPAMAPAPPRPAEEAIAEPFDVAPRGETVAPGQQRVGDAATLPAPIEDEPRTRPSRRRWFNPVTWF
jgi:hypothetical protein